MSNINSDPGLAADPDPSTMIDILRRRGVHQEHRLAYTFLVDGEAEKIDLTYGELDRRSRAIGASLQLAQAAGAPVLLLYPPGLEFITAFLGCLYAGAIAVPAYPPRLNRSQLRLQKIIEDTQATVSLTTRAVRSKAGRIFSETAWAKSLRWLATDEISDEAGKQWREPAVNGDTLAMIQYTSGSTSDPKGVMLSHNNLLINERMIQRAFRQTEESIIFGWLPLYHDMGLIGNVLQPLYLGARCVLMSPTAFLQKPSRWLQAISDYRATTSGGPNFAYDLCIRKVDADVRARLDLSSWVTAFNGSEPIFHETMERFAATFASCGFRPEAFHPCYGLAEATLLVSTGAQPRIEKKMIEPDYFGAKVVQNGQRMRVSCGQVLPGERVVIVDPESLTLCPAEKVGEIWVSGPNIARGYWKRAQETERTFGAYLKEIGEGPFLRTGDLGYLKDGELYVTGRIKDLIIIRGRNHYPQDIELTVQEADPALESGNCAAFSIEHPGEERLIIVKELIRGVRDPGTLIDRIGEAVAREHEVRPHAVVLIDKGSMPKTTSGKIQRYECRNQYQAGRLAAIAQWRETLGAEIESPNLPTAGRYPIVGAFTRQSIEASLSLFLAAKLGRDVEQVDINIPLLRYGVDSLLAIELAHHLESRFGAVVPSESLFEGVTIAQLAQNAADCPSWRAGYSKPSSIPGLTETTEHPLSYGQRGLWFMHQLAPLSGAYNVSSAVWIHSALDPRALKRALQKIVDRHDSLRTTFPSRDGEPSQRVHEKLNVSLFEMDISSWSDEFLDDYLAVETNRPFNLEQGPLLRVSLFGQSPRDHILLVVAHHIVVDLWSMGVLIDELGVFYKAEINSVAVLLDPLPVRYVDYVNRQREALAGQEGERLWSYWRNKLAGDLGALDLPTDRPRPPLQTFEGGSQSIRLSMYLAQALRSLGQNHRATLYITLQAAFHVLLYRYTGQVDIFVGSPTTGRGAAYLSRLIGYFVNPVVLRVDLSDNPTFSEFLEQVRTVTSAALAHQDYPFALLVERLQPVRDPGRSPLFQAMFALQKAPTLGEGGRVSLALTSGARLNFGGLSAETMALRRRASLFDLCLFIVETDNGLDGFIEYNTDLFDEWRIQRMAEHFQRVAEAITANSEQRILEIELMSIEEREQILVEWNETRRSYPRDRSIHELFAQQAKLTPDRIALIGEGQRVSYGELNRRADRLASYLQGLGVGPEVVVGLCLARSLEMVVAAMGVLKAGGAYLPLDPESPLERLGYQLEDAGAGVVLTQEEFEERLPAFWGQTVYLEREWEKIEKEGERKPRSAVDGENLAYVIYTSGSTGRPKGVMVRQNGLVNYTQQICRQLWEKEGVEERGLQFATVSTMTADLGNTCIYPSLVSGGSLHVLSYEVATEGERFEEYLRREWIEVLKIVPSHLRALLGRAEGKEKRLPREYLILGGEALRYELVESLIEGGGGCEVINHYGPTETTIGSLTMRVRERRGGSVPIGGPIANTECYIVDGGLNPVAVGVKGELCIGGEGVARGYIGKPEQTGERFIPNLFSEEGGERLYRTGDMCRHLKDGKIEFLGRADDQVKVRGYRVELKEIEAALNEHRGVRQSIVVAREDRERGKRLVGYVLGEEIATAANLNRYLRERLPEYMVPEVIIVLKEMPLTANGKIDRKRLPPVESAGRQLETEYVGARTAVEAVLIGIFEEVLELDRIGIHDNFFEIGGHSLLVTRVISRVENTFEMRIGVRSMFEATTVAKLAEYLKTREPQPGQVEKIALILKKLNSMTDEDMSQELATMGLAMAKEKIEGTD
jgi:amino acid adenylation domain-containing protein